MPTRRRFINTAINASALAALAPALSLAQGKSEIIKRAIPASGELLPVIGLGSSATFSQVARSEDISALSEVLSALISNGGSLFDTAPGYGASEEVAGQIANTLGITEKIFWATKVNVAPRGGKADLEEARKQIATSFSQINKPVVDLIQVHNLGDTSVQLPLLKELKAEGKIRYLGVTTTFPQQYDELLKLMRTEPLDFIGIDYAIDNRDVEAKILPLALERKIAVLAYAPFGRTRLWSRVRDREVPTWASEFDALSWGQFFLKFILTNPAITAITPATSRAKNMLDNLGGGIGRIPDADMRLRMIKEIESLPMA